MTDDEYAEMMERQAQREEMHRATLRAVERASDIFDRMYRANVIEGKVDPVLDLLDGEVYEFLRAHHPDYGPDA